jgi:hypothetical protein
VDSNKVVIGKTENDARVFASAAGDLGKAMNDKKTLTARKVGTAADLRKRDAKGVNQFTKQAVTVALQKGANEGDLDVILDGKTYSLKKADQVKEDDGKIYGYERDKNDDYLSVWSQDGEITDLFKTDGGYSEILEIYKDYNGGILNSVAVIGTETADAKLATLPTAKYTGSAKWNMRPVSRYVDHKTHTSRVYGDLTLNADFGKGTISGTINKMQYRAPGTEYKDRVDYAGQLKMNEAKFTENGFQSSLSASSDFKDTVKDGIYSGAFYGPEAQQVAGTLRAIIVKDGVDQSALGFFKGVD